VPDKKAEKFDSRKELRSDMWHSMKLSQLYSQELLLQAKMDIAQATNSESIVIQLNRGMVLLQAYIAELTKDDPDPTTTVIMR
jgi:hypothetical protein